MNITPVKITYYFEVLKHKMHAEADHTGDDRKIRYYFDEKLVSEKDIPKGDFLKDDDIIREFVVDYSRSHNDVFADLFNNHIDNVYLVKKTMEFVIDNFGVTMNVNIDEQANLYNVTIATDDGNNSISGKFRAATFSDVLEKVRIFINTLEGVSRELSDNIDEFADDKVLELIKWRK